MLVDTIIKESVGGVALKAEIRKNDQSPDYFVKYYVNGNLNKITRYPLKNVQEIQEQVQEWISNMQVLNG